MLSRAKERAQMCFLCMCGIDGGGVMRIKNKKKNDEKFAQQIGTK
jgi:hypothetical protein